MIEYENGKKFDIINRLSKGIDFTINIQISTNYNPHFLTFKGCIMGDAKEVLGADDIDYITVLDYDTEKKESYWNAAFSDNIKTLIEDSQESVTNMVRMIDMYSFLSIPKFSKFVGINKVFR